DGIRDRTVTGVQTCALPIYVREILDTQRRALPGNIEIQFEADEGGGVVEADATEVRQILMNLVSNARDAMPKGGTLHVEVRRARSEERRVGKGGRWRGGGCG